LVNLLQDSPDLLQRVLVELVEGRFALPVHAGERPGGGDRRRAGLLLAAVAVLGVAVALAHSAGARIAGVSVAWPLGALLLGLLCLLLTRLARLR
jgi:hypothetical protein